jgi:hypothetical protein
MLRPRPLVFPRPVPIRRPLAWFQIDSGSAYQTKLPLRPTVIQRPPAIKLPAKLITPWAGYRLQSPAQHVPLSLIRVFKRQYGYGAQEVRSPSSYYTQPVIVSSTPTNPPTGNTGTGAYPYDLVAACISWLRNQPALVAAFGDNPPNSPAFFSDIAARGEQPPWLCFDEPRATAEFESADSTGQPSATWTGQLYCEVAATGKLSARTLADQVESVLNQAGINMVFSNGVLIYFRASDQEFPTFREPGTGSNIVMYKRGLLFDYIIERWSPAY